ncbi:hypothetical protein [Brevibacterium aurantiacum]|uniref:Uncharacterized protein n=1 Tax=Brevibacterium aurantiacum TaxID=273384 RepID=A0A2A3YS05_BREAU|nr:hypothetical protein [Brevibacterium aurantiacum]PCC42024.1 hypothetical protein CIK65_14700 [Brevibacterium aurantiacum]
MTDVSNTADTLEPSTSRSGRSALVVDPRINQADVDYGLIPDNVEVFRYGTFDSEDVALFGHTVAGWFVEDNVTMSEITKMTIRGEYSIDEILIDSSRSTRCTDEFHRIGLDNVRDYSPLLVTAPKIAAHFIRELRPSALSTMTAAVAAMGYSKIYILGAALSSITTQRPYISVRRRRPTTGVSLSRRYDSWDHTNAEVALLADVATSHPDAVLRDVTVGNRMFPLLKAAKTQPSDHRLIPAPKYPSGFAHLYKQLPVGSQGELLRCAYVTMCDSQDYLWGVRALANSLGRVSDVPLILMVPPGFDCGDITFEMGNVRLYEVNSIRSPHQPKQHQSRFSNTYTKLEAFGLTFLDRVAFIDADTVVLQSTDELFEFEGFAAAPDFGLRLESHRFNSGVFVCSPSSELYMSIIDAIPDTPSYDGGDQGFLNVIMDEITWLPHQFNTLRRALGRYPDVIRGDEARIVHFVGPKPWSLNGEPEWSDLDGLWFAQLSEREKIQFIIELRDKIAAPPPSPPAEAVQPPQLHGYRLAQQLLEAGKPNQAIRVSKEALRNNSSSLANRRVLVRALAASGNRSDAARVAAKTFGLQAARRVRRTLSK